MLVLKRKNGEPIQIHTPDKHVIYLTVNKIGNGQVKIGIDAQAYYAILREDVLRRKSVAGTNQNPRNDSIK